MHVSYINIDNSVRKINLVLPPIYLELFPQGNYHQLFSFLEDPARTISISISIHSGESNRPQGNTWVFMPAKSRAKGFQRGWIISFEALCSLTRIVDLFYLFWKSFGFFVTVFTGRQQRGNDLFALELAGSKSPPWSVSSAFAGSSPPKDSSVLRWFLLRYIPLPFPKPWIRRCDYQVLKYSQASARSEEMLFHCCPTEVARSWLHATSPCQTT